jgi:squalene-associated FAD-dependent desaturase
MPVKRHRVAEPASLAIVGGGLAGLSAAAAAIEHGLRVELFESRGQLGGRTASIVDSPTGATIDLSQHVGMGCCTNFLDFCRRLDLDGFLGSPSEDYTFYGLDGRPRPFRGSAWLPAPLHLHAALGRLDYLAPAERRQIAGALVRLARRRTDDATRTIGQWLDEQKQSPGAMAQFWSPIVVSALSETLGRASLAAARKVFVDGFLAAREAYRLIVPRAPMSPMYDAVRQWLERCGAGVHLSAPVRSIDDGAVVLDDGSRREFDFVVAAVPWWRVGSLLSASLRAELPWLAALDGIEPAPITAVHLWYRAAWPAPAHAMLLERTSQWLFNLAAAPMGGGQESSFYCQVVISASHELLERSDDDILAVVCDELGAIWPDAGRHNLVCGRVITTRRAVFAMLPGTEALRPDQATGIDGLVLAGDWTATGWPATMEGAIRSGRLAVEAVLRQCGRPAMLVTGDLPKALLTRLLLHLP